MSSAFDKKIQSIKEDLSANINIKHDSFEKRLIALESVCITKEEIKNHYISGWTLSKILAYVLFPLVGVLVSGYMYVTPMMIESKMSNLSVKIDRVLERISIHQSQNSRPSRSSK